MLPFDKISNPFKIRFPAITSFYYALKGTFQPRIGGITRPGMAKIAMKARNNFPLSYIY